MRGFLGAETPPCSSYAPLGRAKSRTSELLGGLELEERPLRARSAEAVEAAILEHAGLAIELDDAVALRGEEGGDPEARPAALNRAPARADARRVLR
jgi:hypothetical protein